MITNITVLTEKIYKKYIMKRTVTTLLLILSLVFASYAQEPQTAKPTHDTEILRRVDIMDIEGKIVKNVSVTMKSISPDHIINDHERVKVTIKNANGKTIWKKTLKNSYLYIFPGGQIQIGPASFDKIVIRRENGIFYGMIREKEGVF